MDSRDLQQAIDALTTEQRETVFTLIQFLKREALATTSFEAAADQFMTDPAEFLTWLGSPGAAPARGASFEAKMASAEDILRRYPNTLRSLSK